MKLTFFDMGGRADPLRFILAVGGAVYKENVIKDSDWPAIKPEMPWGQLPILETDDGTVLAQSVAICRYLARKFNLVGSNALENAKCDEYVDAFNDVAKEWVDCKWQESDPERKVEKTKKFADVTSPDFFKKLNDVLKSNGGPHLIGGRLTWADIFIGCCVQSLEIDVSDYPEVTGLRDAVFGDSKIKEFLKKLEAEKENSNSK